MKIKKIYKLDRAVSRTVDSRFATEGVHVDAAKRRVVVTDGRIMAVVPCELEPTPDGVDALQATDSATVSVEAFKAARKAAGRSAELRLGVDSGTSHIETPAGTQSYRHVAGDFPKYEHVLDGARKDSAGGLEVAVNAELLHRLADALGSSTGAVVLTLPKDPKRAILVRPFADGSPADTGADEPVGVIMPLNLK